MLIVDLNEETSFEVDEAEVYAAIDYVLEFPDCLTDVETICVLEIVTAILKQRKLTPRQVVDVLEICAEVESQRAYNF